jgi:NADH:ubiquinone oxidoreductase subunit E
MVNGKGVKKMSYKFTYTDNQMSKFLSKVNEHKKKNGPLMPTLHDAQNIFGCIPLEIQKVISHELGESVSKINGVVTFYSHFTIEPKGKHVIGVCLGTACYVRGSQLIVDEVSKILQLKPGNTSDDNMFTLETTRCIGACGLAPVFTLDGKVFGSATTEIARKAVLECMENKI